MPNVWAVDPQRIPRTGILLAKTCLDCGEFLGAQRFWRNGDNGYRGECNACAKRRADRPPTTAWRMPRNAILVAKTCVDCGDFLMAQRFWRNGKSSRWNACRRCMKRRNYRYSQQRRAA